MPYVTHTGRRSPFPSPPDRLATNALYDALRALVERARDRGPVEEVSPRPEGSSGEDTEDPAANR
ncbi:hypothetical protein GCM10011579_097110 [Streptomyces albiflavescens]|uniref:Uncharacterized protein n=1 Tax=Streptomyces albiflavescens TaxID=1623582 RepID=A0A917YFK7_9ACTN|nr:hypothetical protein GCM10011579_097110 [Streptomyces albiflavescens]